MSLNPEAVSPPTVSGGWLKYGTVTRPMMFQSLFIVNGRTGWNFRENCVSLSGAGPTPKFQFDWNGDAANGAGRVRRSPL